MADKVKTPTELEKATPGEAKKAKPTDGPTGVQTSPKSTTLRKKRRGLLALSFVVFCFVPSALATWYYSNVASDRYATSANFVVRGLNSSGGGSADLVSSFTGLTSSGSTTSDSYIIRRYLESADLVRELEADLEIREHFSDQSIDPISRFDGSKPFEDLVIYWQRRITTTYDSTTGIITFEVQGFTPDFTLELAGRVLNAADALVNRLSKSARSDSVQFATVEVERAEGRLLLAQQAIRTFRSQRGAVNPAINAQLEAELIGTLETQLSDIQARMLALSAQVDGDTPMLRQLGRQSTALLAQIAEKRSAIGEQQGDKGSATADVLAEFETLQLEQTFSQQRYASALSSLENARVDADRQQRYLAIFALPFQPEEAIYPLSLRNVILIILASFALWAISTLVSYAVRDHIN
jgi:capsular polysaccharide transport system permease protein